MKKRFLTTFLFLLIVVFQTFIFYITYQRQVKQPSNDEAIQTRVEGIKQAVKLSSLEIQSEEIFRDTINYKGVVSKVKALIYIHFDLESLQMIEQQDTLYVELPPEVIDVYEMQNGYDILDVWNLQLPEEILDPSLSSNEENQIKGRYPQRFKEKMYEQGYVKIARENAVRSLATLFSKFKGHVIIIDNHPEGWKKQVHQNSPQPSTSLSKPSLD